MAKYVKTEEGYKKYQEVEAINSNKMDASNPVGTGSFSLNRKSGTIVGISSFAEGYSTTASGKYSHAEGNSTTASDIGSHAEGYSTTASGAGSHAEGYNTTASGAGSHAEGYNTTASGSRSHAEGAVTTASGTHSHAEGEGTTASGTHSHAEGYSTNKFSSVVTATNPTNDAIITAWKNKKFSLASGFGSHVEGKDNLALADYSHAEGRNTTASGAYSHAEGESTTASSNRQHVQGKYNIEDSSNTYADIIGNGESSKLSNAATVDWFGNAWYAGDVYVGSTSGTNKDSGSKKLATEEYVNSAVSGIPSGGGDIPEALPNPYALTFTGAVTGSYDGSAPLEVAIPNGEGGTGGGDDVFELIGEATSSGVSNNFGLTIPFDGSLYKTIIAYAYNLPAGNQKRIIIRKREAWYDGSPLGWSGVNDSYLTSMTKMNNTWGFFGAAIDVGGKLFTLGAAESNTNGGHGFFRFWPQNGALPTLSLSDCKFISLDCNSNSEILPDGCSLIVWGVRK